MHSRVIPLALSLPIIQNFQFLVWVHHLGILFGLLKKKNVEKIREIDFSFLAGLLLDFFYWEKNLWYRRYRPRPYLTFLLMKFCSSVKFLLNKVISAYCYRAIFYYIKIFSYEMMIGRGSKNMIFLEKKIFYFIFCSTFFSPRRL